MVMTKHFYTINRQLVGEAATGSTRTSYLTDALGSVTATGNSIAIVLNTYRYKPSGDLLAKTGTSPDPSFGWAGAHGYRPTGNGLSNFYVIHRNVDSHNGRFSTVDPLGVSRVDLNLYRYVMNNPILLTDPSGLQAIGQKRRLQQICSGRSPFKVPRSDPNYKCYADVCNQRVERDLQIDKLDTHYCEWLDSCGQTMSCLDDVRGDTPGFTGSSCDIPLDQKRFWYPSTWGLPSGRNQPGWPNLGPFDACCEECQARFCWFIQEPLRRQMDIWARSAFLQCSKNGRYYPAPKLEVDKDFIECFD